ncbi:glucoamylase family protein [Bacillus alkalisoli]|uniref:glucoamylase family protein n=1 Tax=Bacillus alkalisoli TaxID=2011008 RepID=UPI000C23EDA9|nr:glucoamylase family protein [Bacillus alkalisoli]
MKTKKQALIIGSIAALVIIFTVAAAVNFIANKDDSVKINKDEPEILELESQKSFEFFWNEANVDHNSPGYGLIRDRAPGNPTLSSIASVGFGLTAITIGAERGWITKEEAEERVNGTLDTMLNNAEHINGVYYHFLNMNTAKRAGKSEVSIIDTAILVSGALQAGEYFKGDIKKKADELYKQVNWEWYLNPDRNMFYMSYTPEDGFSGAWDFYAEQLMLYFLAVASPTHPVNEETFYDFIRHEQAYGDGEPFIHSWFGSIFTYQFSHAWFDLRGKVDREGVDWFENSVIASIASRQFSIDNMDRFETFGPNAWGLTASDGPKGYEGLYGSSPSGYDNTAHFTDGTIATAGAAGSIVFTPEESIAALENYYENFPELWGEHGLKGAFNLDLTPHWYAEDSLGIDKGITLLMIENYRSDFVWETMMKNKYVQEGMKKVGLVDSKE